ncbi:MAG: hypothetical protein ABIT36_00770 [Steroidobacteraceae bacterium]
MSQSNPIRLFVTHVWQTSDDYLRVFEYLESARNFFYRNHGTPDIAPTGDAEAQRENLRQQINGAEVVIALSSLAVTDLSMLTFQLNFAKVAKKPVVALKYFGIQKTTPKIITDLADSVIDWEERGLVDNIKLLARHEQTARYEVIEFKLD